MKVLRSGGGYLAEQAERHGTRLLWILVTGGVVATITALTLHPVLGLIPVVIAARLARPVSGKFTHVQHGAQGEEESAHEIEENPHFGLGSLGKSIDIKPTLELQVP